MLLLKLILTIVCLTTKPDFTEKQVIGKLVEKEGTSIRCGVLAVASVNKFIIYKNDQPTNDTLKVILRCPEDKDNDLLKVNSLYKLVISDDLELLKSYTVYDKDSRSNFKKVVLVKIEKY